ncbi:probable cytochrome P450 316a1 [Drosophila bipectinata]|uniref:probable cytochrome P450 316a1 n=1 Tax=Drosophila bipectinata TaxID=42026 RepID=UPI001C8A56A6|nr:probable cytochrome P450 316a1 [Drosophila bipectinata]
MILTTTFVCFCLASAFNYFRTRRQRSLIRNLKGPITWPLMGSIQKLVFLSPKNFFKQSKDYLAKFGLFSRCWIFHRLFIPLADLELTRQLLESEKNLETGCELMKDWLKGGVLMCHQDKWHHRHGLISRLFTKGNMEQLTDLCRKEAEALLPKLSERADQEVFDIWEVISPSILNLMMQVTCGVSPSDKYAKALHDLTELYRKRFLSLQSANRFNYWLSCPFMRRRQNKLIKILNQEHKDLISRHRQQQLKKVNGLEGNPSEPLPQICHEPLLKILLESQDPQLTDEEIFAELNTCNYLGYILCSSALCFAIVSIARNPTVQHSSLEELNNSIIDHKEWRLEKLSYMEALLLESLRLYPPQVILQRQLKQDFPYTHSVVGDAVLPHGAEIYVNLYEMQRLENRYPEPNNFLPERFLNNSTELLSFGLGSRSCPAKKFTFNLLKAFLAPLVTNFELLPYGNQLRLNLRLVLGSSNGFQLALKQRK